MKYQLTIALIALLVLSVAAFGPWGGKKGSTRSALKNRHMLHSSGRRNMQALAQKQYASENYNAYMDLDPHRKKWDQYGDYEKKQALRGIRDKYLKKSSLPENQLNVRENTREKVKTAIRMTHSNTEQLNDAFHAVHDEVNDNLDNVYLGQSGQKKKRW